MVFFALHWGSVMLMQTLLLVYISYLPSASMAEDMLMDVIMVCPHALIQQNEKDRDPAWAFTMFIHLVFMQVCRLQDDRVDEMRKYPRPLGFLFRFRV